MTVHTPLLRQEDARYATDRACTFAREDIRWLRRARQLEQIYMNEHGHTPPPPPPLSAADELRLGITSNPFPTSGSQQQPLHSVAFPSSAMDDDLARLLDCGADTDLGDTQITDSLAVDEGSQEPARVPSVNGREATAEQNKSGTLQAAEHCASTGANRQSEPDEEVSSLLHKHADSKCPADSEQFQSSVSADKPFQASAESSADAIQSGKSTSREFPNDMWVRSGDRVGDFTVSLTEHFDRSMRAHHELSIMLERELARARADIQSLYIVDPSSKAQKASIEYRPIGSPHEDGDNGCVNHFEDANCAFRQSASEGNAKNEDARGNNEYSGITLLHSLSSVRDAVTDADVHRQVAPTKGVIFSSSKRDAASMLTRVNNPSNTIGPHTARVLAALLGEEYSVQGISKPLAHVGRFKSRPTATVKYPDRIQSTVSWNLKSPSTTLVKGKAAPETNRPKGLKDGDESPYNAPAVTAIPAKYLKGGESFGRYCSLVLPNDITGPGDRRSSRDAISRAARRWTAGLTARDSTGHTVKSNVVGHSLGREVSGVYRGISPLFQRWFAERTSSPTAIL